VNASPLLHDALIVDGHTDVPSRLFHHPADLGERLDDGHVDLPRLREGGVAALFFALFVPGRLDPLAGWEHALALYDRVERQLRPGELELVASADDVRRAAAEGAVAVLLGLENGRPLLVPSALPRCASLGVRYVTLTHNESHEWCDASTDEPRHGGLSDAGVGLAREMKRRGILVDVSHVSDDAVLHALDAVRCPVIASHSSARALCDHPRNLPDSLVLEIARRGGVVGANAAPFFLDDAAARVQLRRAAEFERRVAELDPADLEGRVRVRDAMAAEGGFEMPKVPLSRYADHVLHLLDVAGEEHVALGTDFDGITETPEGFEDVSRFPALAEELTARGVGPRVLRMVLGENLLRVLREAERLAE
jgi:membrane dipeptidase